MFRNPVLILLIALPVLLIQAENTAFACSGYPYFGVDDLPTMELLVKATVIDADDMGHNAVIRVENYYKGEGPRLITVMRYPPALGAGAYVRGYDTGCLYRGRGHRWQKGSVGYFGLMSNGDGTFTDNNGGTAHFYPVDGIITYEEGATEGYYVEIDDPLQITEEEFIEKMLEAGERNEPIAPLDNGLPLFYPLMRFLNITTENGTRYQLNPDRSVTELGEDAPLAISPDGAHVAHRVDENSISFQYIWRDYRDENGDFDDENFAQVKSGKAVAFSNDSNMVAVWDEQSLFIYMFFNHEEADYGNRMTIHEVASVDFENDDVIDLPDVRWSAGGSTLVWEDGTLLWHWNLYESTEPQQLSYQATLEELVETDVSLLSISTYGRYVQVGQSSEWILIDSETGEIYENALSSPDEHFLVFMEENYTPEAANLLCVPPLRETCSASAWSLSSDFTFTYQWNLFGVGGCTDSGCFISAQSWHPAIGGNGYSGGRDIDIGVTGLHQIAYDPQHSQPALLVDDYYIYLEFIDTYYVMEEEYRPYLDILDLEDSLDSPIAHVEWGLPVFYDEYANTSYEYIPQ